MILNFSDIKRFKEIYNLLVVLGPTASGKTRLAVSLARALNGEIISADSRQIYRGLDIGTGKEISEYSGAWGSIPVHLIDILAPDVEFSVFSFQKYFIKAFEEISLHGNFPIMAGGTGLYLDSILQGYRMAEVPEDEDLRRRLLAEDMESLRRRLMTLHPSVHNTTDLLDKRRVIRAIEIARFEKNKGKNSSPFHAISPFVIGIHPNREELRRRITLRLNARIEEGLIEEVRQLHEKGLTWERLDALGLEYRYVGLYLRGEVDYDTMVKILNTRIHQFGKRQETWFRKMEKGGVVIHWLDNADPETAYALIASFAHREKRGSIHGLPSQ